MIHLKTDGLIIAICFPLFKHTHDRFLFKHTHAHKPTSVLISLKENFDQALQRDDVKAIVITGAKGKFSGGFDINAFGGLQDGKWEDNLGHWRNGILSASAMSQAPSPANDPTGTLVLAGSRTNMPDILDHFKRYHGGWDITNKHYWAVSF